MRLSSCMIRRMLLSVWIALFPIIWSLHGCCTDPVFRWLCHCRHSTHWTMPMNLLRPYPNCCWCVRWSVVLCLRRCGYRFYKNGFWIICAGKWKENLHPGSLTEDYWIGVAHEFARYRAALCVFTYTPPRKPDKKMKRSATDWVATRAVFASGFQTCRPAKKTRWNIGNVLQSVRRLADGNRRFL